MSQQPTAAIIGAGSSGIAAAKALRERGFPFDCFEASDRIGGNWVFGNRNGMSAAYRDLHINTSRDRMQFSDFPMARSLPDFPHHTQIAAYFDAYADHFGLREHIRFQTAVAHAQLRGDGTWELTDERGATRCYDMLLVANGHHWDARWPEPAFEGSDDFEGLQLHAHEYRDNRFLEGKDVVVLGMGNSAMDIAVESSHVARSTQLAARRGAWIVPKYLFGRPLDQISTSHRVPVPVASKLLELTLRLRDRPARALRAAAARPCAERRAPDDLRPDPRCDRARRRDAAPEHRAARPGLGAVHRRHARARGRRHLLHGLPHQLPVLRRALPRGAGQPDRALQARLLAASSEPRVRRAAPAARRDHAARRGAGPAARRLPVRHLPAAGASTDAGRHPPRGRGDAQALRGLAAPHDPGRLRPLPARARARAPARRRARRGRPASRPPSPRGPSVRRAAGRRRERRRAERPRTRSP